VAGWGPTRNWKVERAKHDLAVICLKTLIVFAEQQLTAIN
jgi:hypothetical protein